LLSTAGCAGSEQAPPKPPSARPVATVAKPAALPHAPGHIARRDLDALLPRGLPWLLKETWPEDVARDGKFVGWRIVKVPGAWGTDYVQPGDVVTSVNGKPLKTPDDLWVAWTSLATASEVRIAYERNGAPREVVLPIDGAPSKDLAEKLSAPPAPPPPAPTANTRRKHTVVIEEDTSLE
jgi:S1-C subfamily serine protease